MVLRRVFTKSSRSSIAPKLELKIVRDESNIVWVGLAMPDSPEAMSIRVSELRLARRRS
jgi:hypothetical protein